MSTQTKKEEALDLKKFKEAVIADYKTAVISRETSLAGRKEVLTGKAKFGIFGDGKEVAQLALAKTFQNGDFRSGYYRDQTWMFAAGLSNVEQFFAQLYADTNLDNEPHSAGRQMNAHFATRSLDENGNWKDLSSMKNSSADISPTAGQFSRALGLAQASKLYRKSEVLPKESGFSKNGNEVVFVSIGDASTSEGIFWETINAAGVLKVPMVISVWDDGYGISVPKKYQTTKGSISEILKGFQVNEKGEGFEIYRVKGWDYASLCTAYEKGVQQVRETHIPAIFHITELTQPQGHSTSGSHERYKSTERLAWEKEYDCIAQMAQWMVEKGIATAESIDVINQEAKEIVKSGKATAWANFTNPIKNDIKEAKILMQQTVHALGAYQEVMDEFNSLIDPTRRDLVKYAKQILFLSLGVENQERNKLQEYVNNYKDYHQYIYSSHLFSESAQAATKIQPEEAIYSDESPVLNGFEIMNKCFDHLFETHENAVAFGEDVGHIGDVNQGFAGLQDKFGKRRIFDTGIRENTIMGQAIGLAMRGLRPIAEIQYLDYLIYGLQPLTDDLATLQYRTKGGQKAPCIIRTRGHRLEGIWHTGSPIGMIINSLRGIHVLTPRNMVQAMGFYNTMMASDEPALIIECLNGYRLKEKLPDNYKTYKLPLGKVEVLKEGTDLTLLSYGSCIRVAEEAIETLEKLGISVELVDAQSLLPFDLNHDTLKSVMKTNRLVVLDEDVPGGASAFLLQKVLVEQNAYPYLDSKPITISAKEHRSPFGSDGDYFAKPNAEDIIEAIVEMMQEAGEL